MTAREMHYDFKQKLNMIDSQRFRGLKVPEIDWKLNEAQEVMVKMVAQPRVARQFGFETSQRTIDDIRTIVVNQKPSDAINLTTFDTSSFIGELPKDYWFYVGSSVIGSKGTCTDVKLNTKEIQHDDEAELSDFDRSNFEWRRVNIRFIKEGIRVFTDSTFEVSKIAINYLLKPRMIHNAQDYVGGTYNDMSGNKLTGTIGCELPEGIHREIVDLAVLITAGDLNLSSYNFKQNKLKLTS